MNNEERIKKNKEEFLAASKKRFIDILERKMKTTYIGALSEIERKIGVMWEDRNYGGILTREQLAKATQEIWTDIWSEMRDRILTNGNNQTKALLKELEQYTLEWQRYKLTFKVGRDNINKEEK